MTDTFLAKPLVVELGDRLAVGLCGGLLQRLGAEVVVVEHAAGRDAPARESKVFHRPVLVAGKQSRRIDFAVAYDVAALAELLQRADVVVTSTDRDPPLPAAVKMVLDAVPVVCDVTAFGNTGPYARVPYTDAMMQAMAGLMDTTGAADGPPTASKVPITECGAAVFAAAGVLCALRGTKLSPGPQRANVTMFDTAVSLLSTFLPGHFAGATPRRIGNRHPSMSPWNAYLASDGWVLLCSASNEMWKRVCVVIGRPDLAQEARFGTMPGRVKYAEDVDATMLPWIRNHTVNECVEKFTAAGVPCGPVYTMAELLTDSNLAARGAFTRVADAVSGAEITVPGPLIRGSCANGRVPERIPVNDVRLDVEAAIHNRTGSESGKRAAAPTDAGVLDGIRVLEMGSYTTAPLAARNLGALGAYVVKLEPPTGELSRASPPHVDGQSYFCTLSNSDKRCVAVDLQTETGRSLFTRLLAKADVFVENMKPGALDRFGFGRDQLLAINPALVYCSVSGFGAGSLLAGRPAMDSTIQGMAGIMDLTRQNDTPFKVGISISDILGGQFALLAVLAGLAYRDRTGKGQFIDLSMQEVSAWLTQFFWNGGVALPSDGRVVQCRDGYVYVSRDGTSSSCVEMTKAEAEQHFKTRGMWCVPVNSVSEVAVHPQTLARELIVQGRARDGRTWPLLACPIKLQPRPAVVSRAIGSVGADLAEVLQDWGIAGDVQAEIHNEKMHAP